MRRRDWHRGAEPAPRWAAWRAACCCLGARANFQFGIWLLPASGRCIRAEQKRIVLLLCCCCCCCGCGSCCGSARGKTPGACLASCAWGALRVCLSMVLAGRGRAQRNVVNAAGIFSGHWTSSLSYYGSSNRHGLCVLLAAWHAWAYLLAVYRPRTGGIALRSAPAHVCALWLARLSTPHHQHALLLPQMGVVS
jgi:hypothetical protein